MVKIMIEKKKENNCEIGVKRGAKQKLHTRTVK